jgi:hypothetical protein
MLPVIAIDGKSIHRSFERARDKSGIAYLVNAFINANHLVFSHVAAEDESYQNRRDFPAIEPVRPGGSHYHN